MTTTDDVPSHFAKGLLDQSTREAQRQSYEDSKPYRHGVIDGLIDDELLRKAREEIIEELRFAEKETDIYKVNQTGDLANLDGLPAEEASRLTSLLKVRNAIYSSHFRQWLQDVTGCGPLSERKKDMSINDYRAGCHLLNHDDVISTRRLSYILYLPDPADPWQPEWGGALELYPVKSKGTPADEPSLAIPPKWNQYTFFTVQPGHSFHSVEEVVHPSRSRLSISGWFHRPQEGETGFTTEDEKREGEVEKEMSSLESLSSKASARAFDQYPESLSPPLPGSLLSADDKKFLMQFINPAYLTEKTQAVLFERFGDDSHVLLSGLLRKEFVEALEKALRAQDAKDGFAWWERGQGEEGVRLPKHGTGLDAGGEGKTAWTTVGPPHRQRYLALAQPTSAGESTSIVSTSTKLPSPLPSSASELLSLLSTILFPSPAFRHFIANVSQLVPIASRPVEARRFRPGLDYTLARADQEAILDVTLCLTPDVAGPFLETERKAGPKGLGGKAKAGGANKRAKTSTANGESASGLSKKSAKQLATKWESGEVGGWECYMAPHEGEEDPAVYQSGGAKKSAQSNGDDEADKGEGSSKANGGDDEGWEDEEMENGADGKQGDGEAVDEDEDEDDEDEDDEDDEDFDGVLLNLTPSFNTLSIALRDEGVMRFVKYLAASAGGSRWDVSAEFTAGAVEEENDEEAEA